MPLPNIPVKTLVPLVASDNDCAFVFTIPGSDAQELPPLEVMYNPFPSLPAKTLLPLCNTALMPLSLGKPVLTVVQLIPLSVDLVIPPLAIVP